MASTPIASPGAGRSPGAALSALVAAVLAVGIAATAHALQQQAGGGRTLAFALLAGALLGLVLQRSRFCFYCHARDWIDGGDPRGLLAILLALAVGSMGTTVVLGSWVAAPAPGLLPPDMHIGPVSVALVAAGLAFGTGMVVSGSCISAHWYRLAEGSAVAPFALLGTALGFLLGFRTWNTLYSQVIAEAPVVWLPAHLGYGGALALQLAVLGGAAALLWRGYARRQAGAPAIAPGIAPAGPAVRPLGAVWQGLWTGRWPYWTGGLAVGLIAAFVIVRMRPLGVTATLGGAARALGTEWGWVPVRLEGLDGLGGCATAPQAQWLTPNALLLAGLVAGAFVAALASRQFAPRWPTARDAVRGLGGGVLLGWGAMTGLGCTVGTLLSGSIAGALSGWVFGVSVLVAVGLGGRAQVALRARG